jgi:hypothetical protein
VPYAENPIIPIDIATSEKYGDFFGDRMFVRWIAGQRYMKGLANHPHPHTHG